MTSIPLPPNAVPLRTESARSPIALARWGAVAFGGVFLAVGAAIILRALIGGTQGMHAPRWVVALAGLVFALAGLWVFTNGVLDVLRRRRAARRAAEYPGQPWIWDHDWRAEGISNDNVRAIAMSFGFALFIAIFLTPFHWIGLFAPGASRAFFFFALLFDAVVVWLIVRGVRLLMMRRRYGASWLQFRRFPFHPGERVETSLDSFGGLSLVPRLTATLRCVQERYETRGTGKDRTIEVVCYALWSASSVVEKDRKGIFTFAFELPEGVPSSALSERPARFWELELQSDDVPGVDYAAKFLIPVYGKGTRGQA